MKHDDEMHTLTGAYALDALTEEEREAFAAHLEHCPACSQEVRGFDATAARLAAGVALAPPPGMKAAVLHGVGAVRQLPPEVPVVRGPARRLRLLTRRAGPWAVAASVAAAATLGGVSLWQGRQAEQARQQADQAAARSQDVTSVLTAPDARITHGRTGNGAAATVVASAARDRAVFLAAGLPPAGPGRTYQLWFADHGVMRPAGLLARDGAVLMHGAVGRAGAVGLTLEPAGGSPQPTGSPLLLLGLPA
ncbi:anti-sigma factor domain-containing protein [Streptomyces sp. NPDC060031]|uniref:anti-sigma factor n=1 Tax=Streptomyces sp. NPDC060031 TaxID=3347043 RepID=UPI003684416E